MSGASFDALLLRARAGLALLLGRLDAAEAAYGRILERAPHDAHALASRAHVRAQRGRRAEAIADAQALVAAHPARSAADWFNLGFLLEAERRDEEAGQAFRRSLELDPALDRAWYGLGLVLVRQERLDEALAALQRNTELQPMGPHGWYQLARLHVDRREPEDARRVIRHLRGFEPRVAARLEQETGLRA